MHCYVGMQRLSSCLAGERQMLQLHPGRTSSDSQALPSISKKSAWSSTTVVRRAELRSAWFRVQGFSKLK
jgi:hypothetical protein